MTTFFGTYRCGHEASTTNRELQGSAGWRIDAWKRRVAGQICAACTPRATLTATFLCGCTDTRKFVGASDVRYGEEWVQTAASRKCPRHRAEDVQVHAAEQAATNRVAHEAAIAAAAELNLPKLKGSPRQIAWAIDIRARVAANAPGSKQLREETSAKWWIEHRGQVAE